MRGAGQKVQQAPREQSPARELDQPFQKRKRRPAILCLEDVSRSDYVPVEDLADAILLEDAKADNESELGPEHGTLHDSIPRAFTSLEAWPQRTNLRCWQCTRTFDTVPKFAPTYVGDSDKGIEIGVEGNMCSWPCAERWIEERTPPHDLRRAQSNLSLICEIFTGSLVEKIPSAPSVVELREYGGALTLDEFGEKIRTLEREMFKAKPNTIVGVLLPEKGKIVLPAPPRRAVEKGGNVWALCR
jgi:hypothetical protein